MVPSAILAIFIHPFTRHVWIARILWAFTVYVEAISILPQLRYMQNAKVWSLSTLFYYNFMPYRVYYNSNILFFQMVETFTGYYVFALGVSRFVSLAYWIIHVRFVNFFFLLKSHIPE